MMDLLSAFVSQLNDHVNSQGTDVLLFQNKVEGLRENLYFLSKENLSTMLEVILEHTEDFTDSAYTSHEHREHILELSKQAKMELEQLVSVWMQAVRAF